MVCNECGTKNLETAKFCKSCGSLLSMLTSPPKKRKKLVPIILASAILGVFGVIQIVDKESNKDLVTGSASKESIEAEVSGEQEKEKDKKTIIKEAQEKVYTITTDTGIGSGFLFQEKGLVVTNAHVVGGHRDVSIRDTDGEEHPGKVIGISDTADIALIEVEALRREKPLESEMETTEIGTEVIALGSPNGYENSASIGYLTGVDRDIDYGFKYEKVYQIDAQVAPGSSGGPLLDAESGKVIGINSLLQNDGNAIGFSIPLYSVNGTLLEWASNPMSSNEVAQVFGLEIYSDEELVEESDEWYEEESYEDTEVDYSDEEYSIEQFLIMYRTYYEQALYYEDFSYVESMLDYESAIYFGIRDYIQEISGKGMIFNFQEFEVISVEMKSNHALVKTHEAFEFLNSAGEWSWEERSKTYKVTADEMGQYVIQSITNS